MNGFAAPDTAAGICSAAIKRGFAAPSPDFPAHNFIFSESNLRKILDSTVWHGNHLIGIDCGSGFPINENAYLEKGRLACLRLDDMKEFYSDGDAKESRR